MAAVVSCIVDEASRRPAMMRRAEADAANTGDDAAASLVDEDAGEDEEDADDEADLAEAEADEDLDAEDADEADIEDEEPEDDEEAALEEEGTSDAPTYPASPLEKSACMETFVPKSTKEGAKSPYWKSTAVKHTDTRVLSGTYSSSNTCLAAAVKHCLVTTAIMWNSNKLSCTCLYGDVNPEGGSNVGHVQWVCKLKKSYMSNLCYFPNWVIGKVKNATRTSLPTVTRASKCAEVAKDKGCDAAELPRGSSGKCECVKKKDKNAKLAIDKNSKTHGICILSYK